jgi:hypothetical protein
MAMGVSKVEAQLNLRPHDPKKMIDVPFLSYFLHVWLPNYLTFYIFSFFILYPSIFLGSCLSFGACLGMMEGVSNFHTWNMKNVKSVAWKRCVKCKFSFLRKEVKTRIKSYQQKNKMKAYKDLFPTFELNEFTHELIGPKQIIFY